LDIQVAEKPKNINQLFKAAKEQREAILLSNDDYIGITTNILAVDNVTQGFRGGDYAVIAARPSMGKTALALQFALSAAFNDVDVMIYSYETKGVSMANRLESNLSGVPLTKVRNPKTLTNGDILDIQAGHALAERISLTIEDKPLKYEVLMNSIRKFKNNSTKKKQLVIIDYIQLIQTVEKFKDANTRITHISTNLKQLAMELDLVMMPLAQLNRGVESRGGDKRPNLADIRDCGAIEQDADTVMFLHRPHYYGQKQDDGSDYEEGYTELLFRKNRNEGVGECAIMYDMKIQRFTDLVPNTYLPESITPSAIQPNANF
jgi:replicative DNA helicase